MSSTAYGWLMLAGFGVSVFFWARLCRRDGRLLAVYVGALFGSLFGSKVAYFAAEGWIKIGHPNFWYDLATGKTILGALLGGYLGVELAKCIARYRSPTGDWFALIAPICILIGRIGCLIHGCCQGVACRSPAWYTLQDAGGEPRWPSVPVELLFNLFAILTFFHLRRGRLLPGQHFHLFLISYGAFRLMHEFARNTPKLGAFSLYQILALALIALGTVRFLERARESEGAIRPVA